MVYKKRVTQYLLHGNYDNVDMLDMMKKRKILRKELSIRCEPQ